MLGGGRVGGGVVGEAVHGFAAFGEGGCEGLGDEVVLGGEVPVEAAVRQACGGHRLGDADLVGALLPDQSGGVVDHLLAVAFGLGP